MPEQIAVVAIGTHFGKDEGETVGYLNHCRVKVGQKFTVTQKQFSEKWMEKLTAKESKAVVEEQADLEADKARKTKKSAAVL